MPNAKWRSVCECAVLLLKGDSAYWERTYIVKYSISGSRTQTHICAQVCLEENSRRRSARQVSLYQPSSLSDFIQICLCLILRFSFFPVVLIHFTLKCQFVTFYFTLVTFWTFIEIQMNAVKICLMDFIRICLYS